MASKQNNRADHQAGKRATYEKNRRRILMTKDYCGICGRLVDKTLPASHPLAPCIDHIIPLAKGGDPIALDNLQLAHRACNAQKGTRMPTAAVMEREEVNNRDLPLSMDWKNYRAPDE